MQLEANKSHEAERWHHVHTCEGVGKAQIQFSSLRRDMLFLYRKVNELQLQSCAWLPFRLVAPEWGKQTMKITC